AQLGRAVDAARLVEVLRDGLQPREEQERRVPEVPPDVDERDRGDDERLVAEEHDAVPAEPLDHLVDEPEPVVEQHQEEHRRDDVGDEVRREDDAAHHHRAREPVHEDRQEDGEDGLEADVEHDVPERDLERVPEDGVRDHPLVVLEPDEPAGAERGRVHEAQPDAAQRGPQEEDDEAGARGQQEEQRGGQVAQVPGATPGAGSRRTRARRGRRVAHPSTSTWISTAWSGSSAGTLRPTDPSTAPLRRVPWAHQAGVVRGSSPRSTGGPPGRTTYVASGSRPGRRTRPAGQVTWRSRRVSPYSASRRSGLTAPCSHRSPPSSERRTTRPVCTSPRTRL